MPSRLRNTSKNQGASANEELYMDTRLVARRLPPCWA